MTESTNRRRGPLWRFGRTVMLAVLMLAFVTLPLGSVQAAVPGCEGDPAPQPEAAGSGADGLLVPPQSQAAIDGSPDGLPPDASLYGQYGTAGQQWHVIRESCVDKLDSSAVATLSNTAWDLSKTINQSTITVYQAATSDGLLASFNELVENVIVELREGIWRPLLPTVIILGAVWLGWYGLIRKRVTLTIESAVWMVLATALGIWILVNPGQILNYAGSAVNTGGQLVNTTVSQISVSGVSNSCPAGSPEIQKADWESENDFMVRKNSQMLWTGLVCRPWVAGQFGSGVISSSAEEKYGLDLLRAQGISRAEQQQISQGEIDPVELAESKQERYEEISQDIQRTYPEIYPIFEGEQQGSRLGVATLALFSSVFAGGLILAGSVALIVLKIGFLLLLLLSPIFLLIGVHPGYGRSVLLRWFEMVLGLLLKQIFIVLLISLLVMCYGLVMGLNFGWGLQMILLALFTVALFIYRKPFAHLFASVNANTFTSRMVSDAVSSNALSKSANALPPVAYMRAQKWGLKRAPQLASAAGAIPAGAGGGGAAMGAAEAAEGGRAPSTPAESDTAAQDGATVRGEGGRARGVGGYGRARGGAAPPPLNLDNQAAREDGGRQQGASPSRSSSQAPKLSDAAAASGGLSSSPSSASSSVPPRPAGGYTGSGDTGWSSVFGGSAKGGQQRPAPRARASGGTAEPAEPTERPESSSGRGIFDGRAATPPRGKVPPEGSRWGGSRNKRQAPPPPRASRPASEQRDGDNWFSSGTSSNESQGPINTPFWASSEGQRRRDASGDIPFWLREDED
ncbi:type IV secretion system protein [Salinactinospora qingdaonensis]|uniref:TrbL/VirB6 plasmid conjugal transfer protein n=1 Tax=Salinactinospora qingdaonensis TaxID=702744 RepID=A0ABP7FMZ0_9ACTN